VRKGPGNCFFDFAQELALVEGTESRQEGRVKRVGELKEQSVRRSVVDERASQEYEVRSHF